MDLGRTLQRCLLTASALRELHLAGAAFLLFPLGHREDRHQGACIKIRYTGEDLRVQIRQGFLVPAQFESNDFRN